MICKAVCDKALRDKGSANTDGDKLFSPRVVNSSTTSISHRFISI